MDYPYLYWPEMPDQAMVQKIEQGDYSEALNLLNFGVCVKECPASSEDPVDCHETSYISGNSKY